MANKGTIQIGDIFTQNQKQFLVVKIKNPRIVLIRFEHGVFEQVEMYPEKVYDMLFMGNLADVSSV